MTDRDRLILVVEDNDNLRYLCMSQLKKLGYPVHYARDGLEAVGMVEQFAYSIILMDLMMPELDGYEATKAIRLLEAKLGRPPVPIIAMTAFQDKLECLEAGMDDYLFKPVMLDDLSQKLQHWSKAK